MSGFAAPATIRQIEFINVLLKDRAVHPDYRNMVLRHNGQMSKKDASQIIGNLKALPKKEGRDSSVTVQPGYYLLRDEVYVVVLTKDKSKSYAKRLDIADGKASWTYAPGLVRRLNDAQPLTIDEAARLGHLHGICVICGTRLTKPASVQAGIGPVCAKRLGAVTV